MKLYCPSCGSGTEYSLNKPQFCASCGSSFTKISTASTAKKVFKPVATVQNTKIEEEEEEEYFSTNIDKLDFNIEGSSRMNHFKIEESNIIDMKENETFLCNFSQHKMNNKTLYP